MQGMAVTCGPREVYEGSVSLFPKVTINGRQLAAVLDVDVFFSALTTDGRLPLFTCECGSFGCGGYSVVVSRSTEAWIVQVPIERGRVPRAADAKDDQEQWMGFWLMGDEAYVLDIEEYRIPWPNMRETAATLLALLRRVQRDHPRARIVSASSGKRDLRQRLAYYQMQMDAAG